VIESSSKEKLPGADALLIEFLKGRPWLSKLKKTAGSRLLTNILVVSGGNYDTIVEDENLFRVLLQVILPLFLSPFFFPILV
jgi:hypothetical protein